MPYFPAHSNSDSVEMEGSSRKKRSRVEMLSPNYKLGKTLGYGAFGEVKLAEHKLTGLHVAIKILNRHEMKKKGMEEKARREIKILKMLTHPHIIRLYEVIETSSDIFVVMEYAKCGELFEYILEKGRLEEDEARSFFQQTISGLEFCHRNMVVHRDLKPENLLLDCKHNVKIADFGLSNIMQDGHFLKTNCGSYNYAAPEVLARELYDGPQVDIWSCGVILYALLCGSLPFDDESIPNLLKKIKGGIYSIPRYLSPGATDMISKILVVDPTRRMRMPEIRQHPWFQAHLPRCLAVPLPDTMQHAKKIDVEIFQEVVKLGFDGKQLIESIICRMQNEDYSTIFFRQPLHTICYWTINSVILMVILELRSKRLRKVVSVQCIQMNLLHQQGTYFQDILLIKDWLYSFRVIGNGLLEFSIELLLMK
ncbi:SNF1-related protein kinase catalytic subunit alpha KIN10 isoform X4 [Populus alba]|uniref:SNF1-related protein kinase catalytic subunit alpha KIN10 isoform X4 n=1 Tax=Populus alba TaxID=43335 RepID=UPI003CC792E6